jgi:hypothetical protein
MAVRWVLISSEIGLYGRATANGLGKARAISPTQHFYAVLYRADAILYCVLCPVNWVTGNDRDGSIEFFVAYQSAVAWSLVSP